MRDDETPAAPSTDEGEPADAALLSRLLPQRYPLGLVDRVLVLEPGARIVVRKGVTAGEPFFAGHFPGRPVVPGVLICEALVQASALLVAGTPPGVGCHAALRLRGLERARFRQAVVPGDVLELEVRVLARADGRWRFRGCASVGTAVAAETDFEVAEVAAPEPAIHPTAVIAPGAVLGVGVRVGPYAVVGADVRIGDRTTIGAHAVIDGHTTLGADNRIFQLASVGAEPQDLKYRGEPSRLEIGDRNIVREFATLNPGTAGGGMVTRVGDDNLFMNYSHVGHDCRIGSRCVLANGTALAGHVTLDDWVIVGGLAAIHQFVRVGESALIGGGAMVTHDVPPFCNASGDRARLRGLNLIGLRRRGFDAERIRALKRAYRILFQSKLSLADARARCGAELGDAADVGRLLDFIAASARGLAPAGRASGPGDDEGDDA